MHAQFLKGISLFPKKASRDNNHVIYSHRLKCGASEANMHCCCLHYPSQGDE